MTTATRALVLVGDDEVSMKQPLERLRGLVGKSGRDQLDLLSNLSTRMASALDLRDLLPAIAATLRGFWPCHWVAIVLPDTATKELRLYGLDAPGAERNPLEGTPVPRSAPEAVFRSGEPLLADRSCDLPLIARGRVVGVLSLASQDEGAFR